MKKKDLEKRIDELVRRVTELEQKPQFVYIPPMTNLPYIPPIPPLGGGITMGDFTQTPYQTSFTWDGTNISE